MVSAEASVWKWIMKGDVQSEIIFTSVLFKIAYFCQVNTPQHKVEMNELSTISKPSASTKRPSASVFKTSVVVPPKCVMTSLGR